MCGRDKRYLLVSFVTAGFLLAHAVPAAAQFGTITGTVTNATTSAVAPNVSVDVYSRGGSFLTSGVTNSSGVYTVGGLPTGSYYVRTINSGLLDQLYQNVPCLRCSVTTTGGTLVAVTAPNPTTINFALAPGGSITGTVTNASTGAGVPTVIVFVYTSNGSQVDFGFTNSSGVYTVGGLPTGSYYVRTINSGLLDQLYQNVPCLNCSVTTSGGTLVAVTAPNPRTINFALTSGATITGTVTNASTGAGVPVSVEIYSSSGTVLTSAFIDSAGAYTTGARLPTGSYYVRTSNSAGLIDQLYQNVPCINCSVTTSGGTLVAVTAPNPTTINFALTPGATITGRVTNASTGAGAPIVSVSVYSSSGSFLTSGSTNGAGVYTTAIGLPTGSYYVRTSNSAAGLRLIDQLYPNVPCLNCSVTTSGGTPVAVTSPNPTTINFALAPGGRITGTVTILATSVAVPNASVQVYSSSGSFLTSAFTANTNDSGVYTTATGLPTGSYYVRTTNSAGLLDQLYQNVPCLNCNVTTSGGTLVAVTSPNLTTIDFALAPATHDLVIDFPGYGVWLRAGGTGAWSQLHALNAKNIATGDLDGNGLDDVIVDFGASAGIWVYYNSSTWSQLHASTANRIVTGDLDGNGKAEILVDFPGFGIYVRSNNTSWVLLHSSSSNNIVTADLDANGKKEAIIDFPGFGIWIWQNNTSWLQLHGSNSKLMTAGDLDGNGRADLIVNFAGFGIWSYSNNTTWAQIHGLDASHLAASDVDGNNRSDVIVDFGSPYGIWTLLNGTTWSQLHAFASKEILTSDLEGNGRPEVVINFGTLGLWQFANNANWVQLHSLSPGVIAAGHIRQP